MSSSYEKSVKGATKIKLAPPKAKYIEHILSATRTGEAGVGEIFRTLQFRLRDTTWTIAFKALIVVHIMIREGDPEATLRYLATDYRKVMAFSTYTDVQTQGRNIRTYSEYLIERARSYAKTKQDYVGAGQNRLKRLSVDKGLLRETESVQSVIKALIKCDMFTTEPENEISLTAFRLLTMDLLVLFQVMNEGTINILEHYFEMSKPDAERALAVYKTFAKQTDQVVGYLQQARAYEQSTRFKVPSIRHAPTSLAANLEEYLRDRDFETNRRQYLAQREAKSRGGGGGGGASSTATSRAFESTKTSAPASTAAFPDPGAQKAAKGPDPDLIDFFSSIEQNQQPMAQNSQQFQEQMNTNPFAQMQQQQQQQQPQQTGFPQQGAFMQQQQPMFQQHTNPFGQVQQQPQQVQMQPQPTGAGFGGYTPQPSQMQQQPTGFDMGASFTQQHSPQQFMPPQHSPLGAIPEQSQPQMQQPQQPQQLQPQQTSTNPFRASMLPPQQTGGTNPFARQQQTGSPFSQPQQSAFATPPPPVPQSPQSTLSPQRTGTNPFAKQAPPPTTPQQQQQQQPTGALVSQATGSTNPFRQSAFVNHNTNTGWQAHQGTMGGLEHLPTIPVFPRPGQAPQQQQQPQQMQMPGQMAGQMTGQMQGQMPGQMMQGGFTGQPGQQQQQQPGQQQQANGSFAGWM